MTEYLKFIFNFGKTEIYSLVLVFSLFIKIFLGLKILFPLYSHSKKIRRLMFFLLLFLLSECLSDLSWFLCISRFIYVPNFWVIFLVRISWLFFILQYQSLSIFLELLTKQFKINLRHILLFIISFSSSFLAAYFIFFGLQEGVYEIVFHKIAMFTFPICFIVPTLFTLLTAVQKEILPKLIVRQLKLFIIGFLIPKVFFEFILRDFVKIFCNFFSTFVPRANSFIVVSSSLLMSFAIYFCLKKMLGLRFLNIKRQVEAKSFTPQFIVKLRQLVEELWNVSGFGELRSRTQQFLVDVFNIPAGKGYLYVRSFEQRFGEDISYVNQKEHDCVERFLENEYANNEGDIKTYLQRKKILIRDDIEFNNFYESTPTYRVALDLLHKLNADIFIPMYEGKKVSAYIVITKGARKELYSKYDHDELIVLAGYISNTVSVLRRKNFEVFIEREKELKEEVFNKHQEINQYKNGMFGLLKKAREKSSQGFMFYRRNSFTFGNLAAQEFVPINPNTKKGHPLTQALEACVKNTERYKSTQTTYYKQGNNRLRITCFPSIFERCYILIIDCPTVSDCLIKNIDSLRDPSQWDYLMYLETTESGRLINSILPGQSPTILEFKLGLLKMALTKKAILLNMPDQDLYAAVDILHKISLHDTLHVLEVQEPEKEFEHAVALFGVSRLLWDTGPALLESIKNGTIYIRDVELLNIETQEHLAEYLRTGYYRMFRSEKRYASSVRIICSTRQNLQELVKDGRFSRALFEELKNTTLVLPSLLAFAPHELEQLTADFSDSLIEAKELKRVMKFNEREKLAIIEQRPLSIHELRNLIYTFLKHKSENNQMNNSVDLSMECQSGDALIKRAVGLGKHAVRDKQLMSLLWDKYRCQTKIASLLGVNRSTICRRFKQYHIGEYSETKKLPNKKPDQKNISEV